MKVSAKSVDAPLIAHALTHIGPLDTLFNHEDPSNLTVEIDDDLIWVKNFPYKEELSHHFGISTKQVMPYAEYRTKIIKMLAEHIAANRVRESGLQPLEAISGNEIIFQILKHYGVDLQTGVAKIRAHQEFTPWKRDDDYIPGLPTEMIIEIDNFGLDIVLDELRFEDLGLTKRNGHMSIAAQLPVSIAQTRIGGPLRDIISHPILDALEIRTVGYDYDRGFIQIQDRVTTPFQTLDIDPDVPEATQRFEQWAATWDSGKDLTPWR